MAAFLPSVVVNISLTFDTRLKVRLGPVQKSTEGLVNDNSQFGVSSDKWDKKPRSIWSAKPQDSIDIGEEPLIVSSGSELNASFVTNRVPKKASIELPGHRPAGTFSLTFDFQELPIDPRTVRGAAVHIYLGTVSQSGFASAMHDTFDDTIESSVLRPGTLGSRASQIMAGTVDEWEVVHGEDGSTVTMSGRDLRGVLIDSPIATSPTGAHTVLEKMDLTKPIDVVVDQLLGFSPLLLGGKISVERVGWPDGEALPAPGPDSLPTHRKGAKGKTTPRATASCSHDKITFWDLITKWCFQVGAIPYFVGTQLYISPARGLYSQQRDRMEGRLKTPFVNGAARTVDAQSGAAISPMYVRRLIYGRDISSVSFKRKFGGYRRPKRIRVTSTDTSSKTKGSTIVEGIYPALTKEQLRFTRSSPDGKSDEKETLYIPVAGVTDPKQLFEMARAVFNEIALGEVGGSCSTNNLSSFGGDNSDPDLLSLRPGDAVEFAADTRALNPNAPLVSPFTDSLRNSFETQVKTLEAKLKDKNFARVLAATAQGSITDIQSFFRISSVSYEWGTDGLKIDFDFENFIEPVHGENDEKTDPEDSRAVARTTTRVRGAQ